MRSPFAWVSDSAQPLVLLALTVLVLGLSLRLASMDRSLVVLEAPRGIVSFELAGSEENARAILDAWSPEAREAAMFVQGLDALYLLAYAAWLSLAAARLGARLGGRWQHAGFIVSWVVLVAAPLDALENHALVQQLMNGPSSVLARIAWATAVPKFALVAAAAAYLVAGLVAWLVRAVRRS